MTISIITPSFGQLEWLRMCVASVADQVNGGKAESGKLKAETEQGDELEANGKLPAFEPSNLRAVRPPLEIEHIIQDGGTPGIEDFAREVGAEFYRDGKLLFGSRPSSPESLPYRLVVYCEADAGMYDAINKGIARIGGDLWAWINSDEQYLPGTLAYVGEWFEKHPSADILCGDALLTDLEGNALAYRRAVSPRALHTRLVHLGVLSCACFYRRAILRRAGRFDTRWRSIGDAEWMERVLKSGGVVRSCRRPLASFAFTGRNTSESPLAIKEGTEWRRGPDAPPAWMRMPVILGHRFRKFLAGAYRRRTLSYSIHRGGGRRIGFHAVGIGWDWPDARRWSLPAERAPSCASVPYADTTMVLGTPLMETTYDELCSKFLDFSSGNGVPLAVDFANTHVVTMRRHDDRFRDLMACIDLTAPDGMPLVWAMNAKGAGLKDRVYGPTFARRFLAACPAGKTHYLIGGSGECGRRFRARMLELNPSLEFIGGYHGACSEDGITDDDETVLAEIVEKKPDFIWVGLGTPKQYAWIKRIKSRLDHGVLLAVGFAFDVNAGMKPDAPIWMQRSGLTWMHRLASEPGRLAGRYLVWNTLFIGYWCAEALGRRILPLKVHLRNTLLCLLKTCSRDIRDHENGRPLGQALLLGWGGGVRVIGHPGLPPLIPRFLPQKRLTYWRQSIGFTTTPRPDFPRIADSPATPPPSRARVLNVVLAHLHGEPLERTIAHWQGICPEENLWIAFGGRRRRFEELGLERAVFVPDHGLRREDNQRGKQSYTGIFHAMAPVIESEKPDYIYFCEYDHVPLRSDLNDLQVEEIAAERADVMGHWLYRVDGTSHYHMLYHQSDPDFLPFWQALSRREDKGVVLSMFGSGSLWSREAFLAIASRTQRIPCYLELYLPTLAHHLGYRVRCWDESRHMISNLPSRRWRPDEARSRNCLTIHPVK